MIGWEYTQYDSFGEIISSGYVKNKSKVTIDNGYFVATPIYWEDIDYHITFDSEDDLDKFTVSNGSPTGNSTGKIADLVDKDGNVKLRYINIDNAQEKVYFQTIDGPKLLIKVTGFTGNFVRGLLMILLMIMVYAGISCTAAAAFSMPTAIFTVLSYMFLGSVAPLVMTTTQLADPSKYAGYWIGKAAMMIVAPLQEFEISQKISGGELVEFYYLFVQFLLYFVMRAVPFIILGLYLYRRRELGLVIRK
jgi:hypothetical protein